MRSKSQARTRGVWRKKDQICCQSKGGVAGGRSMGGQVDADGGGGGCWRRDILKGGSTRGTGRGGIMKDTIPGDVGRPKRKGRGQQRLRKKHQDATTGVGSQRVA